MLDLLRHRADVEMQLLALLVGGADRCAVRRELFVELLQALLQTPENAAFLRQLFLESFYFGVHRRQLFQREDLVRIAQPCAPSRSVPRGPTWTRTRTSPVMSREL